MNVDLACSGLSIGGSERKQRRGKKQASQAKRALARQALTIRPRQLWSWNRLTTLTHLFLFVISNFQQVKKQALFSQLMIFFC